MPLADAAVENPANPLLTGPLRRTVFVLALPVLSEQLLNFLVGFYDVYLSGHLAEGIRTDATAAVGAAAYVGWLGSLIFSLVATGTTALVSRAWGANDRAFANQATNRSLGLSLLLGLGFLAFVLPTARGLSELMGLSGQAVAISERYLKLDAVGLVFTSFSMAISAAFRGCGDMRTPMVILAVVNVVNVVFSTWLVHGGGPVPALGVDGIVAGTVIARVVGGLLFLWQLARGTDDLSLDVRELRLGGETLWRILRIGLPAAAEGVIMWGGHCAFLRIIAYLGPAEFAAHIIGVRVEAITYLPAVAWGAAAATMVGQALGAGDKERAAQAGHEAALQCSLLGLAISLWFLLGAGDIYDLMHDDPAVRAAGTFPFRVVGLFQIPLILSIVYSSALRGAGDTTFPLAATTFATYVIRLPIGYYCAVPLQMGLLGAWMGMNIDMLVRGLLAAWRFTARKWLQTRV